MAETHLHLSFVVTHTYAVFTQKPRTEAFRMLTAGHPAFSIKSLYKHNHLI